MKFIAHPRRAGRTATCGLIMAAGLVMLALQAPAASVTLVASNSIWRYQADGSSQGTAWRSAAFNDSSWPVGQAKLGFGNDGETTPIGASTNGLTTFYFRHSFNNPGTNFFTQALARLLRDDGAVVYLNGVELFRQNMPTGAVDYLTIASSAVSGADENTFFATNIPAALALLQPGANVLAVEVHQSATNSSDLGFNFELTALTGSTPPGVSITNPPNGATFTAGENIEISATASSDSGVAFVQFYANGLMIGGDAAAPYTATFRNPGFGTHTLMAVAQDLGGVRATSAVVNVQAVLHTNGATLIPNHACWSYWDQGTDLGTDWIFPDYNDALWPMGFAELGYGDGDETTVVSFGTDTNNKHITTYFRHRFSVANPAAFTNLILRLKRDDGAVVYLNGTEVFRDNLSAGPVDYLALAALATDDGASYITTNVSPSLLVQEDNVIAVEMHQNSIVSSDISFDLQLLGEAGIEPPVLSIARSGAGNVILSWPEATPSGFILQRANSLSTPIAWTNVFTPVVTVGGRRYVTNTTGLASSFFRLCATGLEPEHCQPPLVLSHSPSAFIGAGGSLALNATVVGTGPLTYRWFRNTYPVTGGTSPVLNLINLQRTNGGAYELCVNGACGFTFTKLIHLVVGGTNVAAADDFGSATVLSGLSGAVNASNTLATAQPGEPTHARQVPAHSIWFSIAAPVTGIVEVRTDGSSFDTVLAVYRGTNVAALQRVAEDDDGGREFRSRVRFPALAGQVFAIAVDGYDGQTGQVQLDWNIVAGGTSLPVIFQQPQDVNTGIGTVANFSVGVSNFTSLQWYHASAPIPGATNSAITLTNVASSDAGFYWVVAANGSNQVESAHAALRVLSATGYTIGVDGYSKRSKCSVSYYHVGILNDPANPPSYCLTNIPRPFKLCAYNNAVSLTLLNAKIRSQYCPTGVWNCYNNCVSVLQPSNISSGTQSASDYRYEILVLQNLGGPITVFCQFE